VLGTKKELTKAGARRRLMEIIHNLGINTPEHLERGVRRLQIIVDAPRPRREGEPDMRVGLWHKTDDRTLMRTSVGPPETDEETLRRLLAMP